MFLLWYIIMTCDKGSKPDSRWLVSTTSLVQFLPLTSEDYRRWNETESFWTCQSNCLRAAFQLEVHPVIIAFTQFSLSFQQTIQNPINSSIVNHNGHVIPVADGRYEQFMMIQLLSPRSSQTIQIINLPAYYFAPSQEANFVAGGLATHCLPQLDIWTTVVFHTCCMILDKFV
jgi:hypothetical protein